MRSAMRSAIMNRFNSDDVGKLVIRLVLGVLILMHGINKLINGVNHIEQMAQGVGLPGVVAYGAYIGEAVGPILLILGFYSRVGATLIAINMIFAIGLAHRGEILQLTQHGGWALELQGMYLFTAVGLALTGAGRIAFKSRWN
jgi:putative oxidoreductase